MSMTNALTTTVPGSTFKEIKTFRTGDYVIFDEEKSEPSPHPMRVLGVVDYDEEIARKQGIRHRQQVLVQRAYRRRSRSGCAATRCRMRYGVS